MSIMVMLLRDLRARLPYRPNTVRC